MLTAFKMSPAKSSSIVTTAIFTIVLITGIRNGLSLKCYICSSLQYDACSSTLEGIEVSTCTFILSTTSTSVSDETTVIDETTGLTENSSYTMETTDSNYTTETSESVSLGTTKIDDNLSDTTIMDVNVANEEESGSVFYERSSAVEHYSCYKIVYHRNNTDVTERGCYISSSLPCSIMGEDEIADSKLKECQTCDQDACNSSLSIDLEPTSMMLSFMIFLLIRYTVSS